jgi:Flp pilus assembly protein TadD
MSTAFTGRTFIGTFSLVLLSIAGLFVIDVFLAKIDSAESQTEATRLYKDAQRLMASGEYQKASDQINNALAIERGNRDYLQTLAKAQLADGKTSDAENTLSQLLSGNSTDGLANLLMGRVLAKEGRFEEAISYFHRAIYGHWAQDTDGNRRRARFELIDLLANHSLKDELLAELLPVQEETPHDLKTRTRIGDLFLVAGSPERAEEVFRGIEHEAPTDEAAYAGLGKAEFARGNYRTAEKDFQSALRLAPSDETTRQELALCNQLLQLDPTLRGLSQEDRYQRSVKLLQLASTDINECAGNNLSADAHALLDHAGDKLKVHVSGPHLGDASEANLDLAEQIWQARKKECKALANNNPLELVLTRMAQ